MTNTAVLDQWPDWSPDGKQIAFRRGLDVYVIDALGEEQNPVALTHLPATLDQMPVWSPDGKQIAFMSFREGYCAVFLVRADGDTPEHPAVNQTPKDPADPAAPAESRPHLFQRIAAVAAPIIIVRRERSIREAVRSGPRATWGHRI